MAYKRKEQIFQPEECLNCRKIWGVDCIRNDPLINKKEINGIIICMEKMSLKPINGKKKVVK